MATEWMSERAGRCRRCGQRALVCTPHGIECTACGGKDFTFPTLSDRRAYWDGPESEIPEGWSKCEQAAVAQERPRSEPSGSRYIRG